MGYFIVHLTVPLAQGAFCAQKCEDIRREFDKLQYYLSLMLHYVGVSEYLRRRVYMECTLAHPLALSPQFTLTSEQSMNYTFVLLFML
jgi:hypothetical protein